MAVNTKINRRRDVNAGEYLPERISRVLDEENYRDNIEAVLKNEADEAFQKALQEKRVALAKALDEKKARLFIGAVVVLRWGGLQFRRVDQVREDAVKIGPCWYGLECIEIPRQDLISTLETELGEI